MKFYFSIFLFGLFVFTLPIYFMSCDNTSDIPVYSGKVIQVDFIDHSVLEKDEWLLEFENNVKIIVIVDESDIIEIGKIYDVFKVNGGIIGGGNYFIAKRKKS